MASTWLDDMRPKLVVPTLGDQGLDSAQGLDFGLVRLPRALLKGDGPNESHAPHGKTKCANFFGIQIWELEQKVNTCGSLVDLIAAQSDTRRWLRASPTIDLKDAVAGFEQRPDWRQSIA